MLVRKLTFKCTVQPWCLLLDLTSFVLHASTFLSNPWYVPSQAGVWISEDDPPLYMLRMVICPFSNSIASKKNSWKLKQPMGLVHLKIHSLRVMYSIQVYLPDILQTMVFSPVRPCHSGTQIHLLFANAKDSFAYHKMKSLQYYKHPKMP